jgi:hypothetical protein
MEGDREETEMDFLVPLLIGLIVGAGGVYYFWARKIEETVLAPNLPTPGSNAEAQLGKVKRWVESAHYVAFGPVGAPDQAQDDAFNLLWAWAEQDEKGMPRG